jgi:hypothetical protein
MIPGSRGAVLFHSRSNEASDANDVNVNVDGECKRTDLLTLVRRTRGDDRVSRTPGHSFDEPLELAAASWPADPEHRAWWGQRLGAASRDACAAAVRRAVDEFARQVRGCLARLRPAQTLKVAFTQDQSGVPVAVVVHIASFLTAAEAAGLSVTDSTANKILGPKVPGKAHLEFTDQLADLHVKLRESDALSDDGFLGSRSPRGEARIRIFSDIAHLAPTLLQTERAWLMSLGPEDSQARVKINQTNFQAAMIQQGCRLPQSAPLPAMVTEERIDLESILPKYLPHISICLEGKKSMKIFIKTKDGDYTFTLQRKRLEDFAALLGSSIENVVEWMATFASGDPSELVNVIGRSSLTNLPVAHAFRYESVSS